MIFLFDLIVLSSTQTLFQISYENVNIVVVILLADLGMTLGDCIMVNNNNDSCDMLIFSIRGSLQPWQTSNAFLTQIPVYLPVKIHYSS